MIAILVAGAAHIAAMRFLCDDAYISFRYAANLVAGHGLVYNPGERIEGYSNFLWTLMSAVVIRVGALPDAVMPVVSALCALATILIVMLAHARRGGRGWVPGVWLAASTAFAAWSTSGLETAAYTLFVTAGIAGLALAHPDADAASPRADRRGLGLSAIAFGLACLTRPDGLIVTACAGVWLAVRGLRYATGWRDLLPWAGRIALLVVPHLLWRQSFYGEWLPHSFAVKTPGIARLATGLADLGWAVLELHLYLPLLAFAAALWMARPALRSGGAPLGLLATVGIPYLGYVAWTGGDFMPLHRFLIPALPLVAWAAGAGLEAVAFQPKGRIVRGAAAPAMALLAVSFIALEVRGSRHHQDPWDERGKLSIASMREDTANWRRTGELLRAIAEPTDTLATSAAGVIPYTCGLYTLDLLGLNGPDLSWFRRRATDRPGHSLILSEERLLALRPQILLGHPLTHRRPAYLGPNLELDPAWRERVLAEYELVGLTLPGLPPAYVGCGLRKDVASRIAARAASPPSAERQR